jgi:chemotaxis protein MotB
MRGGRGGRRRRGGHDEGHGGGDERWLLTYSDLITLLMALFIVMYSISSVNTSKFKSLHASLQDAFSGRIMPGGRSIMDAGASDAVQKQLVAVDQASTASSSSAAQLEDQDFQALKERIDRYAREHGLQDKIRTKIDRRGLTIVVLTDKLLFDSGSAVLQPPGVDLMRSIGGALRQEGSHQVLVEGYTDDVPIQGTYPSNWELSTARASTVVRTLVSARVSPERLTASGRAYLDPVASNSTAAGRSRNRRVQIVLPRQAGGAADGAGAGSPEPSIGPPDVAFGPKETP